LTLDFTNASSGGTTNARDPISFLDQLRPGIPPDLRYINLSQFLVQNVALIVERGFPMVRVIRVGNNYWTVERHLRGLGDLSGPGHSVIGGTQEGVLLQMEQWPRKRVTCHAAEWLEWLGCGCAIQVDCPDAAFPE